MKYLGDNNGTTNQPLTGLLGFLPFAVPTVLVQCGSSAWVAQKNTTLRRKGTDDPREWEIEATEARESCSGRSRNKNFVMAFLFFCGRVPVVGKSHL